MWLKFSKKTPVPQADVDTKCAAILCDRPAGLEALEVPTPGLAAPPTPPLVIENFLSPEECRELIALSERQGYEQAQVNIGGGRQRLNTSVRKTSRCMIDVPKAASILFDRLAPFIPQHGPRGGWVCPVGLNERLRFLRYDPGDFFRPHSDGRFDRPDGDTSLMTVMLYLNEPEAGGDTIFLDYDSTENSPVAPQTGLCLLFDHDLVHEGAMLKRGVKYAIRTDVMFTRRPARAGVGDALPSGHGRSPQNY